MSPNLPSGVVGDTVELLQTMIRNACVNTGDVDSGHEHRNVDVLIDMLEGTGVDIERYESAPGRSSMVARITGSDPDAPSVCLMGHTDVVPVNEAGWTHDPFGGEVITSPEGITEVWGRGAVDMLNLTASMAVVFRDLARSGFQPRGDLVLFAVADEEAGGTWGAEWMFEHHRDAIWADYVLTELGGWSTVGGDGVRRVTINTGEKGLAWRRLRIGGTPGHGSMPYGTDNALVTAAEVIRRLSSYRPAAHLGEIWAAQVDSMRLDQNLRDQLLDPDRIDDALSTLPVSIARSCHALTHTTIAPTVAHGGQKTNMIPDMIEIDVDIRTVPGTTSDDVQAMLADILGELADRVEVSALQSAEATESRAGTELWDALSAEAQIAFPGAELIPGLVVGATDARIYREHGAVAYGAGLFSPNLTAGDFGQRFHGHDERVDIDSLELTAQLWRGVIDRMMG